MANREQPYDPYIPAGGSAPSGSAAQDGGNQRTAALQAVSDLICSIPSWMTLDRRSHTVYDSDISQVILRMMS